MLTELCQEIKNWFAVEVHSGTHTITNGNIDADWLRDGQYFRIKGSIFSDGVHQYPAANLQDETFDGYVWGLAIPAEVVRLSEEIDAWKTKYGAAAASPYQSESFGGYSYNKGSSIGRGGGWKNAFGSELNKWRKI